MPILRPRDVKTRKAIAVYCRGLSSRRFPIVTDIDNDQFDFFVSYARADNTQGWITDYVNQLVAAHPAYSGGRNFNPFFDESNVRPLDDWKHELEKGLSQSFLFLAFISPNYFASKYCRWEWRAWIDQEISKHILTQGVAAQYIVEVPGLYDEADEQDIARQIAKLCHQSVPDDAFSRSALPLIRQVPTRQTTEIYPFFSRGIEALREHDLQKTLTDLAKSLEKRTAYAERAKKSRSTLPQYNRRFSGRMEELTDLRSRLTQGLSAITGVNGLGGVGKTELAFTFAHAFAGAYPGGSFIVSCDNQPSLLASVLATPTLTEVFADQITDAQRMRPEIYFAAIAQALSRRLDELGPVLLVLDNITDANVLSSSEIDRLAPLGDKLHLLATTRLPTTASSQIQWVTLDKLSTDESLDLLEKFRSFEDDAAETAGAKKIVDRLDGFVLALELVGAYLSTDPSVSFVSVAAGLGLDGLKTIAEHNDVKLHQHDQEQRLHAVLAPSISSLSDAGKRAVEYAALLSPDHVALPWLRELVLAQFPELAQKNALGSDPWWKLCDLLTRLGLFARADGQGHSPKVVRIHRLVQEVIKDGLEDSTLEHMEDAVHELMKQRDASMGKATKWESARWEIEPMEALAHRWADMEPEHPKSGWLLNQVGQRWDHLADWTRAEAAMLRVLSLYETSLGKDHPNVATAFNNLAGLLEATNRLDEAEPMRHRVVEIFLKFTAQTGHPHPHLQAAVNNYALLLKAMGKPEQEVRRIIGDLLSQYGQSLGG